MFSLFTLTCFTIRKKETFYSTLQGHYTDNGIITFYHNLTFRFLLFPWEKLSIAFPAFPCQYMEPCPGDVIISDSDMLCLFMHSLSMHSCSTDCIFVSLYLCMVVWLYGCIVVWLYTCIHVLRNNRILVYLYTCILVQRNIGIMI